jgi:hypothetical protein
LFGISVTPSQQRRRQYLARDLEQMRELRSLQARQLQGPVGRIDQGNVNKFDHGAEF